MSCFKKIWNGDFTFMVLVYLGCRGKRPSTVCLYVCLCVRPSVCLSVCLWTLTLGDDTVLSSIFFLFIFLAFSALSCKLVRLVGSALHRSWKLSCNRAPVNDVVRNLPTATFKYCIAQAPQLHWCATYWPWWMQWQHYNWHTVSAHTLRSVFSTAN